MDAAILPAPLSVTSRFVINEKIISVADLQPRMGKSSISHVAAFLAERKKPFIRVLKGTAEMNLTEIFQWLRRYKTLQDSLKDVKTLTGIVNLSSMNFGGPLFRPALWNRAIAGSIEQIKIDSRLLPGPLTAPRGNFSLESNKILLDDVRAAILDTKVTGSGAISGDRREMHEIDLRFTGTARHGKHCVGICQVRAAEGIYNQRPSGFYEFSSNLAGEGGHVIRGRSYCGQRTCTFN